MTDASKMIGDLLEQGDLGDPWRFTPRPVDKSKQPVAARYFADGSGIFWDNNLGEWRTV